MTLFSQISAMSFGVNKIHRCCGLVNGVLVILLYLVVLMLLMACQERPGVEVAIEDSGAFAAQRYVLRFGDFSSQRNLAKDFMAPSNDKFCFGFWGEVDVNEYGDAGVRLFIEVSDGDALKFKRSGELTEWVKSSRADGGYFYYGREGVSTCSLLKRNQRYSVRAEVLGVNEFRKNLELITLGGGWK